MTDGNQYSHNAKLVDAAEAKRAGYTTPAMLRHFREKYCLSQREASRLIGAGKSAFGKYESGHHLSKPCAKLIRVALFVPEAAEFLASEEGIEIDTFSSMDDVWDLEGVETTRAIVRFRPFAFPDEAANMGAFYDTPVWPSERLMEA